MGSTQSSSKESSGRIGSYIAQGLSISKTKNAAAPAARTSSSPVLLAAESKGQPTTGQAMQTDGNENISTARPQSLREFSATAIASTATPLINAANSSRNASFSAPGRKTRASAVPPTAITRRPSIADASHKPAKWTFNSTLITSSVALANRTNATTASTSSNNCRKVKNGGNSPLQHAAFNSSGNPALDQCWIQWLNYWDYQTNYAHVDLWNESLSKYMTEYYTQSHVYEEVCEDMFTEMFTDFASTSTPSGGYDQEVPVTETTTEIDTFTLTADGFTTVDKSTSTDVYVVSVPDLNAPPPTDIGTWTETDTLTRTYGDVGSPTLSLTTATRTEIGQTDVDYSSTPITTSTQIDTNYFTDGSISQVSLKSLPTPKCELPGSVPQCQALWNTWASRQVMATPTIASPSCAGEPGSCMTSLSAYWSVWSSFSVLRSTASPSCTQASINSQLCESLRSSYVSAGYSGNNAVITSDGETGFSGGFVQETTDIPITPLDSSFPDIFFLPTTTSYLPASWPSSSSLAAGCTLGCGVCAVTGGTVRLLHWPPATATPAANGTWGSLRARSNVEVATTLGTVFTSPTIYISLANIHAGNSCSAVGKAHNNTILPLTNTAQLSSIWSQYQGGISTASFNFTDLNSPIPESIYSRQPWCAAWTSQMATYDLAFGACNNTMQFWADQNTCYPSCPRTKSFNPILVLPSGFLNPIDPAWTSCQLDIRGVFDPPITLTPYASAAQPVAAPTTATSDPAPLAASTESLPEVPTPKQTGNSPMATDPSSSASNVVQSIFIPLASSSLASGAPASPSAVKPGSALPQQSSAKSADPSVAVDPSSAAGNILSALHPSPATQASQPAPSPAQQPPSNSATSPVSVPVNGPAPTHSLPASIGANTLTPSKTAQPAQAGSDPPQPAPADPAAPHSTARDPAHPSDASTTNIPQTIAAGPSVLNAPTKGTTLQPGATTIIAGTPVSVGSGGVIVAGGSTLNSPAIDPSPNTPPATEASAPAPPAAVVTLGGSTYTAQLGQPLNVDGTTIAPNAPVHTIAGQTVSVGSNGVNVGGSHVAFSSAPAPAPSIQDPAAPNAVPNTPAAVVTIGGSTYTAHPSKPLNIGGTNIVPNAPAQTIAGQRVSVGSGGVNVEGSNIAFSATPTANSAPGTQQPGRPVTIGGQVFTALPDGSLVVAPNAAAESSPSYAAVVTVGGQTYTAQPGSPLTIAGSTVLAGGPGAIISGQTVSLGATGVAINGQNTPFSAASEPVDSEPQAVLTVGGQTYTAQSGSPLIIAGSTLSSNGPAVTISGQTISLGPTGVAINGQTTPFSATAAPVGAKPQAELTIGGHPYTAQSGSPFVIGGSTISIDGPAVTVSGDTISVGPGAIVMNGQTVPFTAVPPSALPEAGVTIGGQPYTAQSGSPITIDGSTISNDGPAATISGQTISLGSKGVQVNGQETPFTTPSPANPEAVLTLAGHTYTVESGRPLVMGSATLTAGGSAATMFGQTVSMASNGVLVNGQNVAFTTPAPSNPEVILTFGGRTYTAQEGQPLTLGSAVISPGGAPATVSDKTISIASSGVVINGITEAFTQGSDATAIMETDAPFTISGTPYTAYALPASSGVVIDGPSGFHTTLSGHDVAISIGGSVVSAEPGLAGIDVGSSHIPLVTQTASVVQEAQFSGSDGQMLTAIRSPSSAGAGQVVIVNGSITLTEGGTGTTIDGESVSAGISGLVINGTATESWSAATVAGTGSSNALGASPTGSTLDGGSSGSAATGAGATAEARRETTRIGCLVVVLIIILMFWG
ncbi:MAG: hypothetical protein M1822_003144 [Bathelium mastoideum]|nr:MAG: hypothetical protein M1822_003144 [Bathelium mastoideum]